MLCEHVLLISDNLFKEGELNSKIHDRLIHERLMPAWVPTIGVKLYRKTPSTIGELASPTTHWVYVSGVSALLFLRRSNTEARKNADWTRKAITVQKTGWCSTGRLILFQLFRGG
jgi:hypothetical protein